MPVEVSGAPWWSRTVRTLAQLILHPSASFRGVCEPVVHGPVLRYLIPLRLPPWGLVMGALFLRWATAEPGPVPIRTSLATDVVGLQLGQVLAIWALLLVPLRIPLLYFFGGIAAHVVMTLTGGAHRSIGATMRAFGYALSPLLLVVGALEVPLVLSNLSPELWFVVFGGASLVCLVLAGFALARTHDTPLTRAFVVAIVPMVLVSAVEYSAASLELAHVPFAPDPVRGPYHLPPPPP